MFEGMINNLLQQWGINPEQFKTQITQAFEQCKKISEDTARIREILEGEQKQLQDHSEQK